MIQTGFDNRVKIQDIVSNQLPNYILEESPTAVDFLKQYYISQEYQGGPVDIAENLDQYLDVDNLIPEVIVGFTTLSTGISTSSTTINVSSTKGFPNQYGLLKINDEVITYTGLTTNSFTGCIRGFSGITSYHQDLNQEELVFSDTETSTHSSSTKIQNLSSLFLKEFYKKTKYTFTPGLEETDFYSGINVGNFIKEAKSLYQTKGTDESFRILFNVLYGTTPDIINLENNLLKPSSADYIRRQVAIAEVISGDPLKLKGQSLFRNDINADINASISEIEPFNRVGVGTYYKVGLFVGYDEISDVQGDFIVIPNSKSLEDVSVGSSIISVDSTIGFSTAGTIRSGINTISYSDKSINQFLNCTWVGTGSTIYATDNVRSDNFYYGYEDGDITKQVILRFTGVLSSFFKTTPLDVNENDIISVKTIGDKVSNPDKNKTYKQIFANSWIYNTSSSYNIKRGSTISPLTLDSPIYRSSLKYGDTVEIVERESNKVVYPLDGDNIPVVSEEIDDGTYIVTLQNFNESLNPNIEYKLRRKVSKASSLNTPIVYGNDTVLADIQNVYIQRDNEYAYVASNSLPGFKGSYPYNEQITEKVKTISLDISNNVGFLTGLSNDVYNTIAFADQVPFEIGDRVFYESEGSPLSGLEDGIYYVNLVGDDGKRIKLYGSSSGIIDDRHITFTVAPNGDDVHKFTLYSQKSREIGPQKLLKKFKLPADISSGIGQSTSSGTTGMLINGVEISNYKSPDKIYYGPIESVSVLNNGSNYDVINPPNLLISAGSGTTAFATPVISGSIEDISVDPQNFDIDSITSINISGGNGTGCILEPIVAERYREVVFNANTTLNGGGINTSTEQIVFLEDHYFIDGEPIVYDTNLNIGLGVGSGDGKLVNNAIYYPDISNNKTIKLHETYADYVAGINTVNLNGNNAVGLHKFKVGPRNTLLEVKVLNGGTNYTNRLLKVKPVGINTANNTINFENHNFQSGEIVEYTPSSGQSGDIISGLTTTNQYKVVKIDDNSFRLCDIGVGATISSNYVSKNYTKLETTGNGYQHFSYPKIEASVDFIAVGVGTTSIDLTPTVKGNIKEVYLYDGGIGYGSTILNDRQRPFVNLQIGKDAAMTPYVINGKLNSINIEYGGKEYYSIPDVTLFDPTGTGSGAKIRPIIENLKIVDTKITNAGIGYSTSSVIKITSSGTNASFDAKIRGLEINQFNKFGKNLLLESYSNKLKYTVCGYTTNTFNDGDSKTSGIIGWAYDGNPIYGPYGYTDPQENPSNPTTNPIRLQSGYVLDINKISDRPVGFASGYFTEDYYYDSSVGDLDEHNGRFEKNVDFPNGVYAYRALVDSSDDPVFPYFIGDKYRSKPEKENLEVFDQSLFDFNNKDILRNTFPYKVSDKNANNDFLVETPEIVDQKIEIESVSSGPITGFDIISAGSKFKCGDILNFDSTGTSGDGLITKVKSIKGRKVDNIQTTIEEYDNSILLWEDNQVKIHIPNNNLNDKDFINLSGISTNISKLNSSYQIGITSYTASTISTCIASPSIGFTTEIYVSSVPDSVSIGSSISIGTETLKILNIFKNLNVIRVKRGFTSFNVEHPESSLVNYIPDNFTINQTVPFFDSKLNNKAYFNPAKSAGIGTVDGTEYATTFDFAGRSITRNIPIRELYIENHGFEHNQRINLTIPFAGSNLSVSTTTNNVTFNLPTTGLYAVPKTINTLGIKTGLEHTELYFRSIGGTGDNDEYLLKTELNQVTGKVDRIKSTVSVSTAHGLTSGDVVKLDIKPDLSVGLGATPSISVERNEGAGTSNDGFILINGKTIGTVNIHTDRLNIPNHGYKTGDKLFYKGNAGGLVNTASYFVYRQDDDFLQFGHTLYDVQQDPPNIVAITTATGGNAQKLALINPQIECVRNNNLVFDLSNSTLNGYNFKIYHDNEFKNEFVSTGSTSPFSVSNDGSLLTIGYGNSLPSVLYYNVEKSGFISTADKDVKNYSSIVLVDSLYNESYNISGVGTTTFNIYLKNTPETLSYGSTQCDKLDYSTTSLSAEGPINNIDIVSGGSNYKKIPTYVGVAGTTSFGQDAVILPTSEFIGDVEKVRIINEGFEYSSDKTLEPEAYISPIIQLDNASTLGIVSVTDGGSNFIIAPDIIIVNTDTGERIESGFLEPIMLESSIININVEEQPLGLPETTVTLRTINNTNGINIKSIGSNSGSSFQCTLTTPILGFNIPPFSTGQNVFIEGIEKISEDGTGFNSADYGYKLLTISAYDIIAGDVRLTIDVSPYTSNTGIAKTLPSEYAYAVNENDYPEFYVKQVTSPFSIGESITVNGNETNLVITESSSNTIKVSEDYEFKIGDIILGKNSGNTASIKKIRENFGRYKTGFSLLKDIGWNDTVGKLSDDTQVIANNDYYQNLSYSIKSPLEWKKIQTPVNNLLHTSGLKNFSDTGITSTAGVSIGSSNVTSIVYDIIEEHRVDTDYYIDMVYDEEPAGATSRLIKFENIRLSDYIDCRSNEVFTIDNINESFSNLNSGVTQHIDIFEFGAADIYNNYIVRINSIDQVTNDYQLNELVILSTGSNNALLEKSSFTNSGAGYTSYPENIIGKWELFEDTNINKNFVRFIPNNPNDYDYDIKIISSKYYSNLAGFGSASVGPVDLNSFVGTVNSGSTGNIISVPSDKFGSFHVTSQITDTVTNKINFVESYVTHNGQDTFISEFYVNSDATALSLDKIGILTSSLSANMFSFNFENDTSNNVKVRSKIVGFGTTGVSNGVYRFTATGQPDGTERSAFYQGITNTGIGTTAIFKDEGLNKSVFDAVKSIVEVSIGSSKALHEVLTINDDIGDTYVQQSQILSVDTGSNSQYDPAVGLGTFGGAVSGDDFNVWFHPDNLTGVTTLTVLNQCFYRNLDLANVPTPLTYGKIVEDVDNELYNAINGGRINRKDFPVNRNSIPIFAKSFNPSDSNDLNLSTGNFTLDNHYFRANEELVYTPGSTFAGISSSPMTYKNQSSGISSTLPSRVFVKTVVNDNNFTISTTRAGAAVTFVNVGTGNYHQFAMAKANEKSLISIDDIVQSPITPTDIQYTLENNVGSQIGAGTSILSLSGISTLTTGNLLKIGNEYTKILAVGMGTTTSGPIGAAGTYSLVRVERAVAGTIATTYTDTTEVDLFKGSYNITGKDIWFLEAPRGNPNVQQLSNALPFPTSSFNGRAYFRNNYRSNIIYDDISNNFNGITTTFTLTVGGANTTGIGTSGGSGILFINGVFQTPTTDNNPDNNFQIIENAGISSVVFTGITSSDGSLAISDSDVNMNQLPRGGVPISIGSSNGLGYARLTPAIVRPVINSNGSLTSIVGIGTTGTALGIQTAQYNKVTGIVTITTSSEHGFVFGYNDSDSVKLSGLVFECDSAYAGMTTTIFPSGVYGDQFSIISVASTNTFTVNVGTSTVTHSYVGQGTVYPYYGDLTFGSGYNDIVPIEVKVNDRGYDHKFVSASTGAINKVSGGQLTPISANYDPVSGIITFTASNHGMNTTDLVTLDNNSLVFTCSKDNHTTTHSYPRNGIDPVVGVQTNITRVNEDIFSIFVGSSVGTGAVVTASPVGINTHEFISGTSQSVKIVNCVANPGLNNTFIAPANGTSYNPVNGRLTVFKTSHNLATNDTILLTNNSLSFSCAQDSHQTVHTYPRGGLEHKFVSATSTAVNGSLQPINAIYNGDTGYMTLTFTSAHGISNGATITIADNSLTLTCAKDGHATEHTYPRSTDPISGIGTVVSNATANSGKDLTVNVGRSGLSDPIAGITTAITKTSNNEFYIEVGKSSNHGGGALKFDIVGAGVSYKNPYITVSEPSYDNLSVRGISRLGEGATTDTGVGLLVNAIVGPSSTLIGSDPGFFEISEYDIKRSGYAFREGDIFEPVGLVTDRRLIEIVDKTSLTVDKTYSDDFSLWQFGEFDFIDSIKAFQDGIRVKFPLYYNGSLISLEASEGLDADIAAVLLIVINGIIQEPNKSYTFTGGSAFVFTSPPDPSDNVAVFFYKGTDSVDCVVVDAEIPPIEIGDDVQILQNPSISTTRSQEKRTVLSLNTSQALETNVYRGPGINNLDKKPIALMKQKIDKVINKEVVSKKRIDLEPRVYPTTKIIQDVATSGGEFYVTSAELFDYDGGTPTFGGLIVSGEPDPVPAKATTTIGNNGDVTAITLVNGGSGYKTTPTVSISAPPNLVDDNNVAIGITATATATLNGDVVDSSFTITNAGTGYTVAPNILIETQEASYEILPSGSSLAIEHTSGFITGIGTTSAGAVSGGTLGIRLVAISTSGFDPISVGSPIYIYDSRVGDGVISIDGTDTNTVGVGTSFADNIYKVSEFTSSGLAGDPGNPMVGIITCNIKSDTDVIGLSSTGDAKNPVAKYSLGKFTGFSRSGSPISIGVTGLKIDSGLTTFPTLQRRGGVDTFESTGAIKTPT